MNENVIKLNQAIELLVFLNDSLSSIDNDCKDIINGIFSLSKYENLDYFNSLEKRSYELPKTLNFPVLYSLEDSSIKESLEKYKRLFE